MSLNRNAPGYNHLINGNFDIWQRGTKQETSGYGSDDRWMNDHLGTKKIHYRGKFKPDQKFPDGTPTPKYYSATEVYADAGEYTYAMKHQKIALENTDCGHDAELVFYSKANIPSEMVIELVKEFKGKRVVRIYTERINVSDKWTKHTIRFYIPAVEATEIQLDKTLDIKLWFDAGSSYSDSWHDSLRQSGIFGIAKSSLVIGDIDVSPVQRAIEEELELCCKYYQKIDSTQLCTNIDYEQLSKMNSLPKYEFIIDIPD